MNDGDPKLTSSPQEPNGVSLTVNEVEVERFGVLIIPHTLKVTTLGERKIGDAVNIEADLMARYAARLAETR